MPSNTARDLRQDMEMLNEAANPKKLSEKARRIPREIEKSQNDLKDLVMKIANTENINLINKYSDDLAKKHKHLAKLVAMKLKLKYLNLHS